MDIYRALIRGPYSSFVDVSPFHGFLSQVLQVQGVNPFVIFYSVILIWFLSYQVGERRRRSNSEIEMGSLVNPNGSSVVRYSVDVIPDQNIACPLPKLNPYHESVMKYIRDIGSLQCRGKRYFNLEGGILKVQADKDVSDVTYSVIERPKGDDFSYNMGRTNTFADIPEKRKLLLTGKCPIVATSRDT